MKLTETDPKTFDEYVLNSPKPHFMQSSAWGEVNRKRNYIPHYIVLEDNGAIRGSALLLEKKILMYRSFYCSRGFITDYSDRELVKTFLSLLKRYVKERNGLYLKADPDIIIRKLNDDGSVKETFEENLSLIDLFKEEGGRYKGFTTKFTETAAPRFSFRVNVDRSDEELIASFHSTTRNILKRNNPYHLHFLKGDASNVPDFYKTMKETSVRKQMYVEPLSFFEDFYTVLKRYDMSEIYVVYALKSELVQLFEEKKAEIGKEKEKLLSSSSKKAQNRLKDIYDMEKKQEKEYAQVLEMKEEKIILSSMICAKHKDKVWTVHGGNSDDLKFLNANYELYYGILKDARDSGYKIVDFFGTEGKVDPSSDIYGIYLFKLRFAGDFDEFLGEFDFIVRPLAFSIIEKLLIMRRRYLITKSLKNA